MAQDRPDAVDLLETVSAFLRDLLPRVEGGDRFHTRVSIHLVDMVARELRFGGGYDAAELARLRDLLGRAGSLEELNRALSEEIRAGRLDARWEEVSAHALRTVEDKLRIVNPEHLEHADRRAGSGGDGSGR